MRGLISTKRLFDGEIFVNSCSVLGASDFNNIMYLDPSGSVGNAFT